MNWALLFSAAALIISIFSLIYFKAYLRRRTGQERILSEFRNEVNKILKSIDATTDRDISLIEEREKTLKSLLEEIEKRLRIYIREMEKGREAGQALFALNPAKTPDKQDENQAVTSAPAPPGRTNETYQELGKNRYRINRQVLSQATEPAFPLRSFEVTTAPSPEGGQSQEAGSAPPGAAGDTPSPVTDQIRELVKAGFPPAIIASRLDISITEVEFMEALMERKVS